MMHVDIINLHVNMHNSCIAIIPSNKLHAANKNDFFVNINEFAWQIPHTIFFFILLKKSYSSPVAVISEWILCFQYMFFHFNW